MLVVRPNRAEEALSWRAHMERFHFQALLRTYRRLFDRIDVADRDRRTGGWFAEQQRLRVSAGMAMDGKTVLCSGKGDKPARHLLSAIVHGGVAR